MIMGCRGRLGGSRLLGAVLALASASGVLAGCTGLAASPVAAPATGLRVVAAENFWGSLAAQLGGRRAHVVSLVTDPNADPHEFEAAAADARLVAEADLVVVNGAGYDDWAGKLLAANPEPRRRVLDVATLLGKHPGDNPHFWYSPTYVEKVIGAITDAYGQLAPAERRYFAERRAGLEGALGQYRARIASMRASFSGQPVAATEDVVVYLAQAIGLVVVSPVSFMRAVSESNDPPAAAVASFQLQLSRREADVLVYNRQTVTSVTTNLRAIAVRAGIPVVGVTETLQPPRATFQQWQDAQLASLARALMVGAQRSGARAGA